MANILSMARLLGFRDFWPNEKPKSKEFYAEKLGRDLIQQLCCFFLGYFRHKQPPPIQQLMAEWFTYYDHRPLNSPSYLEVIDKYKYIVRHSPQDQRHDIISIESLLNIFLWTLTADIPDKVDNLDASSTLRSFEFLLLFNNDVLDNYEKAAHSIDGMDDDRRVQRLIFTATFSQHDLVNIDYAQLFFTQIYKLAELLRFMDGHDRYKPLLSQLLTEFGCDSTSDFLKSVASAVFQPLNNRKPGWTVLQISENDENKAKSQRILDNLSLPLDAEVPDEQDDYRPLRNSPFQKISDTQYRVIFDLFLIKKLYNGTVFKLSRYDKAFYSDIRSDFSEGVLVYDILKAVLPENNTVKLTGDQFKAVKLKREPDYYFKQENVIVLFESKDFFMTGEEKLSYDFNTIEGGLKKDGRLLKAVVQLAKNIQRCIDKQIPLDKAYSVEEMSILPVIIVHDSLYGAPGLNFWVHYWLKDELDKLKADPKYSSFDFSRIRPLTILEIDTLILYQELFQSGQFDLIYLIRKFHGHVRYEAVGHLPPNEVETHAKMSAISFSEFVRDYAHSKKVEIDFTIISKKLNQFGIQ
jgi:hypothetical protein